MELEEALSSVKDQPTFLAFVKVLITDREVASQLERKKPEFLNLVDANGWYNSTIEGFLEAAVACVEFGGNQEMKAALSQENPWRYFAEFLYSGKIYE
ncbi:hypothetical protein EON80_04760 [bacterium]|nr:MAG: hypothetical protein EON80_04760 [bacterium]